MRTGQTRPSNGAQTEIAVSAIRYPKGDRMTREVQRLISSTVRSLSSRSLDSHRQRPFSPDSLLPSLGPPLTPALYPRGVRLQGQALRARYARP